MKANISLFMLLLVLGGSLAAAADRPIPVPTKGQYRWHEQERIMFVCLDPCTWQGREYDNHSSDLKEMTLPKLDTDQWCRAALAWGAKEILFVAKHTGGFCWWQTDTTEYSVKNISWRVGKGDLVDELARSCKEYGLTMGIYVYPGDATWGAGIGSGGKTGDPKKQEAYNKIFRQQVREATQIALRHTEVVEFWFDGSCVIDVSDIMQEEAPDAVIFQGPYATIRWVGTERGSLLYDKSWCTLMKSDLQNGAATSHNSTPDGDAWAASEVNTTLYDHYWFWSKEKENARKSLDELMRVYYESAGQGTVMLLNSTPTTEGLIPEADIKLYTALGEEINRRFDKPLAQTQGKGTEFVIDLNEPTSINHVIVMEEYRRGERIRRYFVEGWNGREWVAITDGAHVGRKHINFFDDSTVSKVKLKITESMGEPLIRSFSVYYVADFVKPVLSSHVPYVADAERIASMKHSRQTNWRTCGKWNEADYENDSIDLHIDLTGKITEAGQWQIKFRPAAEQADLQFSNAVLLQHNQPSAPGMLAQSDEDPLIWNVNRTAVVTEGTEDIRLTITLSGAPCSGNVVVRRR